jgi:glycosyltransferase involved in cell wall biosynthesis
LSKPRCTVVVATYNRVALLRRMLNALQEQDLGADQFEVVVVDDGSSDETQAFLQSVETPLNLRHFRQENQGPGAARNLGVRNAQADIIITLDDDVTPAPNLLRRHVELQEAFPHSIATGVMVLPPNKSLSPWLEWEAAALEKQYQAMIKGVWRPSPRQFYTANASFWRQDAIDAGLFDTSFRRAEDVELAFRMRDLVGVSFYFIPDAVVYHEPNRSYSEWLRVPQLYGLYDVEMWQRKGVRSIIKSMRDDFKVRRPVLRGAGRLLVGRPAALHGFTAAAALLAAGSSAVGLRRPCRALYSAIFNLEYWQGFCDAIGGRRRFWQCIDGADLEDAERRADDAIPGATPTATDGSPP